MIPYNKETWQFIRDNRSADPKKLALSTQKHPEIDLSLAITQIAGRQAIREKVPSWYQNDNIVYPRHLSIEQCSSELTALYKASLVKGDSLVDLTGGFGIDCGFFSSHFKKVTYVERQKELCELASHNFSELGLHNITIINQDSGDFIRDLEKVDCVFLDPARRDQVGRKTVSIADCEPNVKELAPILLEKAETVIVKLSPMLDLSLAIQDLPQTSEVYVISVENECKELVLVVRKEHSSERQIHCINLFKSGKKEEFTFNRSSELSTTCNYTSHLKQYLYEPNASILKAGAYKSIASFYQLDKLHPNSHLYTSDSLIPDFPGRAFRCETSFPFNKKALKSGIGSIGKANITIRNFPASVAELRKRIKLKEGGDVYLFATTLSDEQKVILRCKKV